MIKLTNKLKAKLLFKTFLSISLLQSNPSLNDLNIYSKKDLDLILDNSSNDLVYLPTHIRNILKSINLDLEDISILEFRTIREIFEALPKKEDLINSISPKNLDEIEQYILKIDDYKIDSKKLRSGIIDRLKIKNLIAKYGSIKTLNVHELLINCKPFEPCNCSGAGATGATGVTGPTGPGSGSTGATGVTGATGTFNSNFSGCIAGPILLNSGSSGAPAYSFCSKTGTGIYLDATGLAFVYDDPNFAYLTLDSFNLSTGVLKAEDFATPNMRLVIAPKGNGALQTRTDGDERGQYTIDLQRFGSTSQVTAADYAVISGGSENSIDNSSTGSIISGGRLNSNIRSYYSTISGGTGNNNTDSYYSYLAGGRLSSNTGSDFSTISGGYLNINTNSAFSVISGGSENSNSSSEYQTIAGGRININSESDFSTISGGYLNNNISSNFSTISGGYLNNNTGSEFSTISGGRNNSITNSDASFSAGSGAQVLNAHHGSFVWSDGTYGAGSISNGANTFNVYSTGGIFLENLPDASGTPISINGTQLVRETSSKRYKKEITKLEDKKSELIYNLNPVEFLYNNQNTGPKEIGLIAEDVENISNQLVIYNNKGEVESVKYRYLPILMLNEMKKFKANDEILELKLLEKDKKINDLENKIESIINKLNISL